MYKKTFTTLIIIVALSMAGSAYAGTKFINKDTAKERKPIKFGTDVDNTEITIKSDKKSNTMSTKPRKKEEDENQSVGPIFVVPEIKP
ncbi:hypothetical protein [Maridesulfovibrio sp. FT414]|uniref:hypothetical protein n=1 Tax=Maridesulfovibrio sp. FT414 TaxID=2979469 RepID=UPI003D80836A